VDDELLAMEQFEQECREWDEIELIGKFNSAEGALECAAGTTVEFALLDICLPGMNGIELGQKLKQMHPKIIIIYLTGYSKYIVDAVRSKADYCIMKPYTKEDVADALMRVKLLSQRFQKRLRVETFGRFEVYVDGNQVYFGNGKARELFAYCIHREGGNVAMEEAVDVLWPDRPYDERVKRLYRKAVGSIQTVMEQMQLPDVFVNNRGCCHIEKDKVECDLYRFLEGRGREKYGKRLIEDGYMSEYGWTEKRIPGLLMQIEEEKTI